MAAIRRTKAGNFMRIDMASPSNTAVRMTVGPVSIANSGSVVIRPSTGQLTLQRSGPSDKVLKNAIYNHLRFLKARGEIEISLEHISKSLDIPIRDIIRLAPSLKGVKVA